MATDKSLKTPAEMSFAEFANAVKPSGAVNRFPSIGVGVDVYSYSVYMNGPLAAELPEHAREHAFISYWPPPANSQGLRLAVKDHAVVPASQQASDHARAHSTEANHTDLHRKSPFLAKRATKLCFTPPFKR